MEAVRFFKIAIVVLLLVNVATLSFMWMNQPTNREDHPRRGEGRGPGEFLIHELQLNDEQQEQYEVMRSHHHETVMEIRRKAGGYRRRINDQLKVAVADSLLIRQLSDSIGYCQRDAELITFYHFQDLRRICTPKQQQKFDQVIQEAIQMLAENR
jgi:Spy/CpxP family protein refolding chaperone